MKGLGPRLRMKGLGSRLHIPCCRAGPHIKGSRGVGLLLPQPRRGWWLLLP